MMLVGNVVPAPVIAFQLNPIDNLCGLVWVILVTVCQAADVHRKAAKKLCKMHWNLEGMSCICPKACSFIFEVLARNTFPSPSIFTGHLWPFWRLDAAVGFEGALAQHQERAGDAAAEFKRSIDDVQAEQAPRRKTSNQFDQKF